MPIGQDVLKFSRATQAKWSESISLGTAAEHHFVAEYGRIHQGVKWTAYGDQAIHVVTVQQLYLQYARLVGCPAGHGGHRRGDSGDRLRRRAHDCEEIPGNPQLHSG